MNNQSEQTAVNDLSELEYLFSEYHVHGELVQDIKSKVQARPEEAVSQLNMLESRCSFNLIPGELAEGIELCIDSLRNLIRNKDNEKAIKEFKASKTDLNEFMNRPEAEIVSIWDQKVLEAISNYSGEHVIAAKKHGKALDVSIRTFINKVIYSNTGLSKQILPQAEVSKSLVPEYQRTAEFFYGLERHEVSVVVSGNNSKIVEQTAKKQLLNQVNLRQYRKEVRNVNSCIADMIEAEETVVEKGLPAYGSTREAEKIKNFIAREMISTAEDALGINIQARPEDVVMKLENNVTGYFGKTGEGKWIIKFSQDKEEGSMFDLMKDNPEKLSFSQLVSYIDNTPTGFTGRQAEEHTPSRAPDIFLVDLIHELGHVVSNMAAESVFYDGSYNRKYQNLIEENIGKKKGEKAANEIAGLTVKRLAGNMGGETWKPIFKGFESYLEMTKYDSKSQGYRIQHPIYGNEEALRDLYYGRK